MQPGHSALFPGGDTRVGSPFGALSRVGLKEGGSLEQRDVRAGLGLSW